MIHLTRTSCVMPGEMGNALAFSKQVTEHIAATHQVALTMMFPVGGNPFRIAWTTTYPDLGALGDFHAKLLGDRKYAEIIAAAADSFVPGATTDEIWRTL